MNIKRGGITAFFFSALLFEPFSAANAFALTTSAYENVLSTNKSGAPRQESWAVPNCSIALCAISIASEEEMLEQIERAQKEIEKLERRKKKQAALERQQAEDIQRDQERQARAEARKAERELEKQQEAELERQKDAEREAEKSSREQLKRERQAAEDLERQAEAEARKQAKEQRRLEREQEQAQEAERDRRRDEERAARRQEKEAEERQRADERAERERLQQIEQQLDAGQTQEEEAFKEAEKLRKKEARRAEKERDALEEIERNRERQIKQATKEAEQLQRQLDEHRAEGVAENQELDEATSKQMQRALDKTKRNLEKIERQKAAEEDQQRHDAEEAQRRQVEESDLEEQRQKEADSQQARDIERQQNLQEGDDEQKILNEAKKIQQENLIRIAKNLKRAQAELNRQNDQGGDDSQAEQDAARDKLAKNLSKIEGQVEDAQSDTEVILQEDRNLEKQKAAEREAKAQDVIQRQLKKLQSAKSASEAAVSEPTQQKPPRTILPQSPKAVAAPLQSDNTLANGWQPLRNTPGVEYIDSADGFRVYRSLPDSSYLNKMWVLKKNTSTGLAIGAKDPKAFAARLPDEFQKSMDAASLLPGAGTAADGINASVSGVRVGYDTIIGDSESAKKHLAEGALSLGGAMTPGASGGIAKSSANKIKSQLKALDKTGPTSEVTGKSCVYVCTINGIVRYVGQTSDVERRGRQHMREKGIAVETIPGFATLGDFDKRAVEQTLIEYYGLGKNGGSLLYNKINSISKTKNRFKYEESLLRGSELLKNAHYPGFK